MPQPRRLLAAVLLPNSAAGEGLQPPEWLARLSLPPQIVETPAAGAPGWLPWTDGRRANPGQQAAAGIGKPLLDTWTGQLQAIGAVLRGAPVLAQPLGFHYQLSGTVGVVDAQAWAGRPRQAPLAGTLMLGPWPKSQVRTAADGTPLEHGPHETAHLIVHANRLPSMAHSLWMSDDDGGFFPLVLDGHWQGLPILRGSLVLSRGDRLPVRPVGRGRVLAAWLRANGADGGGHAVVDEVMAQRRADYEAYRSPESLLRRRAEIDAAVAKAQAMYGGDPEQAWRVDKARKRAEGEDRAYEDKLREMAALNAEPNEALATASVNARELRRLHDGMSAAERIAPAWLAADRSNWQTEIRLVPPNTPGAYPVVEEDPAFFDARLPRDAIQILTVGNLRFLADGGGQRSNDPGRGAHAVDLQVLREIDWPALRDRYVR